MLLLNGMNIASIGFLFYYIISSYEHDAESCVQKLPLMKKHFELIFE